jgi:hypothetical protein
MLNKIVAAKTKIHTRDIRLATYSHTDSRVIVHGVLKDKRYLKTFDVTGAVREPGTIHHMDVKFLINSNPLRIEDAQAQMLHVPLPECHSTLDLVDRLKGMEIKSGFSKNIHTIMGGKKGCTHLCQLIVTMGQEIVQGWLTHNGQNKPVAPASLDALDEKKFLINSCRMWTPKGPKMKSLERAIKQGYSD